MDKKQTHKRVKTPTVLQMEAVECGAAALAIILGYHGRIVPLEELRTTCGVSRDGSKANNVLKAARTYGLIAAGFKHDVDGLKNLKVPTIVFWNFNHFLVVEGFKGKKIYLNDPASGPRVVDQDEFNESFTGIVLTFEPGPDFKKGGRKKGIYRSLAVRLKGLELALTYVVLVGMCLVIPGLVIPVFSKVFIDDILVSGREYWIKPLLLGMGLTALLRGGLSWMQQYYLLRFRTRLALTESSKFFWHVIRLPIEFFNQRFGGEISSRVAINDKVALVLSGELARTVIDMITVFFYAIILYRYNALMTLIGICMAMVNIIVLKVVSRVRTDRSRNMLQEKGKMLGVSMGGLQAIESLKATGRETDFFSKWAGYQAKVLNARQDLAKLAQPLALIPPMLTALNTTVILAVGGFLVIEGKLTMGMLIAFQSLMTSFMTPFTNISNLGGTIQDLEGDMNRLDDVMACEIDPIFSFEPKTGIRRNGSGKLDGLIELKNISFGYSILEPPLIENFSLKLQPGQRMALVGASGSGKSTIAKLITGLYPVWEGEILFDGIRYQDLPREVFTNSVAVVDQEIFLFKGSVKENLTLWDDSLTEKNMVHAARSACIHEILAGRPGGYESIIDEGGVNFSGGQRQRIEIARALVNNPSILILDEATSALDAYTEKVIDDNLRRRGCTCIIVAHRLSTIRDCDEIIVLDQGKVVQRGTHDDLKEVDGHYRNLISMI